MKSENRLKIGLLAGCLLVGRMGTGQTTAFTYQGRLNDSGAIANGSYDLTFAAYDDPTNGNLVGGIVTNSAVTVSNGIFTTPVDFGPGVFTGLDLWLEISVSTNGAGTFSTIIPRQMFTPTPYALYAQEAGTADNVAASAVSATQLNTLGAPAAGQVLAYNGTQLVWQAPTVGGNTGGWSLTGNLGTTTGVNFLGTLDNVPLELIAGGARALRLEPDTTGGGAPNVIGGSAFNSVSGGITGATIAGGGAATASGFSYSNTVTAGFGAIGGGVRNTASGQFAEIGGGFQNLAGGYISAVAGGAYNVARTNEAAVLGGAYNVASGIGSTIGGGGYDGSFASGNGASGAVSFIGGGIGNAAAGYAAAVNGGYGNSASGPQAAIGGGDGNVASGSDTVFYGFDPVRFLSGDSTVSGGYGNAASASGATVPGGAFNAAAGDFSFAGGYHASALNDGAFVWADDSTSTTFSSAASYQFLIRASGGMGIGTSQTPPGGLRIGTGGLAVTGASSPNYPGSAGVFIEKGGNNTGLVFAYDYVNNGVLSLCLNSPGGFVGIGTLSPAATLDVNGTTKTHSIIITGGSDVAEPFKMGGDDIPKGSVVVIDDSNPGALKVSAREYDTRVAGIVSGANGINPGVSLHQDGVLEGGQNVALSGRVYVLAEASNGPIKPGDLLTTSNTPGHAMRVTDHSRSQGAVIGKAMTGLDHGSGMVLVLVTLQ